MECIIVTKVLPFSSGKYKLDQFGQIIDKHGLPLDLKVVDGKKLVTLDWVFGYTDYELGAIIAITHLNIKIPTVYWDQVEPIYHDGDALNVNISNIGYRFKSGPIETYNHPGFYYIPFFTRYAISRSGDLINTNSGEIHSWSVIKPEESKNTKGGYRNTWATSDTLSLKNINRHRAIALAFIHYPSDPFKLVVNHVDGIPGNDAEDNLEWLTRAENNQHAYDNGLIHSARKILMKNLATGAIEQFQSIAACVRKINRSETFIRNRIFDKPGTEYSDGLVFKLDDGGEWPLLTEKASVGGRTREIVARNIFTGSLYVFDSATSAFEYLKITSTTVLKHAVGNLVIPIDGFNFRFNEDGVVWPNHSERHLRIYRIYPRDASDGVVIKDINGVELEFFESVKLAGEAYGYSYCTMRRFCKANKSINGSTFSLYRLEENLGPSIE